MTAVLVLLHVVTVTSAARAQVCGDADGSGTTSVSDAVQILRRVAGLSSSCSPRVCDVDGDDSVTVTDGVVMLRRAAQLPAATSCGTRFGTLVKTIVTDGLTADLQIGELPRPEPGSPQTVVAFDGPTKIPRSQTASFHLQLSGAVDSLVVAVRESSAVVDGFVELSVAGNPGSVTFQLTVGDPPSDTAIDLMVAGRVSDRLSEFLSRPLEILAVPPGSRAGTVSVGARAAIFGAGNAGLPAGGEHPIRIPLEPGTSRVLRVFDVRGTVNPDAAGNFPLGPDGGFFFNSRVDIPEFGGISGVLDHSRDSCLALMAVVIAGPPNGPAPARLDVTTTKFDVRFRPEINQIFFVGDGLSGRGSGETQEFFLPDVATELVFGFADANGFVGPACCYSDNAGALEVSFSVAPGP